MSTYIGKVQIGDNEIASIGSTLYGVCSTTIDTASKVVTLADFNSAVHGITIFVRFIYGNSVTSGVTLKAGSVATTTPSDGGYAVLGNCVCRANEVLAFTLDKSNSSGNIVETDATGETWHWIVVGHVNDVISPHSSATAVGAVANAGSSTNYARGDHVHNITVAEGGNSGEIIIAGQTVKPKDLGSAAYTSADTYMPKSGGTFTGDVTLNGAPTENLHAATKAYVDTEISTALTGATSAMIFKGTIGASTENPAPTINTLPTPASGYSAGWTYRVITAGDYGDNNTHLICEDGDLLIAINNSSGSGSSIVPTDWTIAQGNVDSAVYKGTNNFVDGHVVITDGTNGQVKDSGFTIGTSVPSDAVFTDTDHQYHLVTNNVDAFTGITTYDSTAQTSSTAVAVVANGILTLIPGITFSTTTISLADGAQSS